MTMTSPASAMVTADAVAEVAAIGAQPEVAGFALAGARVCPAGDDEQARAAWRTLPGTVAVVILTRASAEAIGAESTAPGTPLTVVMPP
jgi:vacuolar-type H+-ATPase subunit F/Vma7